MCLFYDTSFITLVLIILSRIIYNYLQLYNNHFKSTGWYPIKKIYMNEFTEFAVACETIYNIYL